MRDLSGRFCCKAKCGSHAVVGCSSRPVQTTALGDVDEQNGIGYGYHDDALTIIQRRAIEPEEAFLERRFGADYIRYKENVRRWI